MLTPSWLDGLDLGDPVSSDPLEGGFASKTYRVRTTLGRSVVVKTQTGLPPDLYGLEAEGLDALRASGGFVVPEVLRVGADFIVMTDLGSAAPGPTYWEDAGRALAVQHRQTADKFGYHQDNYLGILPHRNPWMADGHAFFAQHRLLRYLEFPKCFNALEPGDRQALENLAAHLPELIPPQQPSLLHGDLWHANLLATPSGAPALVDPAINYGWPEAELSMLDGYGYEGGRIPDAFYAAYTELHPLEPGWADRFPLLHLREQLCILAHLGTEAPQSIEQVHLTLAPFTTG
ncbi:fructosamine kinase family protein [Kribbella sp. NPDC055071]